MCGIRLGHPLCVLVSLIGIEWCRGSNEKGIKGFVSVVKVILPIQGMLSAFGGVSIRTQKVLPIWGVHVVGGPGALETGR